MSLFAFAVIYLCLAAVTHAVFLASAVHEAKTDPVYGDCLKEWRFHAFILVSSLLWPVVWPLAMYEAGSK